MCTGSNPDSPGGGDDPIDVADLLSALRRLRKRLERLAARLDGMRDEVDAAAYALEQAQRQFSSVSVPAGRHGALRSPSERAVMQAEADAGAASLRVTRRPNGTGEVSVGGRRAFPVPPKLTTLLVILTVPGDETEDGLFAWQSTAAVAAELNRKTGGTLAPRAVPRLLYKLRRVFREAGENFLLIESCRTRGVRLAVRR